MRDDAQLLRAYAEGGDEAAFAELVNRIFSPGCDVYLEEEHFSESIRQAMKTAYTPDK